MPFDFAQVDADPVVLALVRAKRRIDDPKNWCQGALGKIDGKDAPWERPEGCNQFCARGALHEQNHWTMSGDADAALNTAATQLFPHVVGDFKSAAHVYVNNELGHAAVMQVYDKAIETARARALQAR